MPSGRMSNVDLGPLTIAYPDNWQVMKPTQKGQSVQIAPSAGVTSNAIGYGVVINGIRGENGEDFDALTNELVQAMKKGDSNLRTVNSAQNIDVAGSQGRSVMMETVSPFPAANGQPQKERDWLVTVPRGDGSVLYLVFVAPTSEFDRFKPAFDSMIGSIRLK